MHYLGEVENIK